MCIHIYVCVCIHIYEFASEKEVGYVGKGWRKEREGGNDVIIILLQNEKNI